MQPTYYLKSRCQIFHKSRRENIFLIRANILVLGCTAKTFSKSRHQFLWPIFVSTNSYLKPRPQLFLLVATSVLVKSSQNCFHRSRREMFSQDTPSVFYHVALSIFFKSRFQGSFFTSQPANFFFRSAAKKFSRCQSFLKPCLRLYFATKVFS